MRFKLNIGQMASAISVLKTDEACGKFFIRLMKYVQGTDEASSDAIVEAIFQLAKVGIDEEKRFLDKQRANGQKGGAPKGNKNAKKEQPKTTQNNPKQPKTTDIDLGCKGIANDVENVSVTVDNQPFTENNPKQPSVVKKEDDLLLSNIDNSSNILDKDNNSISISNNTSNVNTTKSSEIDLIAFAKFWNDNIIRNKSIMAQIKTIGGKRKSAVLARLREHGREDLGKVVKIATASDFMNGKNNHSWVGSFDWIFQHPNNFVKVLEGNYNNRDIQPMTIGTSYHDRPTSGAGKTLEALTQIINENGTNTANIESAESSNDNGGQVGADYCSYVLSEKSSY